MLKIGEFSKLSRISIRMLRHYDELGLLKPAETDHFTGYRYYSESQLETAGRIASFRDMGFGLTEIGDMLTCSDDRLTDHFRRHEADLRALLDDTAHRLRLLETAEERLRKEMPMNYNVTLKTVPERTVASVRMTIPSYDSEGLLWDILCAETDPLGIVPDTPCLCSAVFHDDEYKESDVDVEVQKTVKGNYKNTEHVVFRTEPPVTVASAVHNGSYDTLSGAMTAVAEWIRDNGYELCGAAFNIYHVSPHETGDASQFVTEVCYPVRKR